MRLFQKRLLSVLALVVLSFGLVACDSGGDNGGDTLPADEAKNRVQEADQEVASNVNELLSGPFGSTMSQLGFLNLALGSFSSDAKQTSQPPLGVLLIEELDTVFEVNDGQLQASSGEYDWNAQQRTWSRVGGAGSNIAVLNFPSNPNQPSTNNATFTLASYQDQQVTLDGDPANVPSAVSANLAVGGTTIFSVDLSGVNFYSQTADGSQVPRSFDLNVLTLPHRHNFALSSGSRSQFEFEFDLNREDDDTQVFGLLVDATLLNNFDQLSGDDAEEVFDNLSGSLDYGPNVTVDYDVNVSGLASFDDPSAQQINDNFSATMNYQGQKVGDIVYEEDVEIEIGNTGESFQTDTFVLVYENGDREPLQEVFQNTTSTSPVPITATARSLPGTLYETVTNSVKSLF